MDNQTLIIGGGVIGLCTAYYLNKAGFLVTVIDNGEEGSRTAASYGNAGFISPSHFIPLASPGVVSQGLRWMLKSSSPFYIHPRLNRDLIFWGLKFMRSTTAANVNKYKDFLLKFNLESQRLFVEMEMETGLDFNLRRSGLLVLYKTGKARESEYQHGEMALKMGLKVEFLNREELKKAEPAVHPDVTGGVLYHIDWFLDPVKLMDGLKQYLKNAGVKMIFNTEISGFKSQNNRITEAMSTGDENFKAGEFVIASGVWTSRLMKTLKINLPMQGGKGYNVTLENPATQINYPAILAEASSAVTPFKNRLRLAGTMQIDGYDLSITRKRVENIIKRTATYYNLKDEDKFLKLKPWAGLRPVTPDGVPFIGRVRKFENLTVCTGHAMMGLSQGAVSGKSVSEIVSGAGLSFDPACLDPERFSK